MDEVLRALGKFVPQVETRNISSLDFCAQLGWMQAALT